MDAYPQILRCAARQWPLRAEDVDCLIRSAEYRPFPMIRPNLLLRTGQADPAFGFLLEVKPG